MNKPNNSSLMKAQNRSLCLSLIRQEPVSRAELARKTGLTRAAVSIIVDGLLNEGVIIEGDAVKSLNGRHPTLLHLNPSAFNIIGIDILRDGWFLVLTDFSGNIIESYAEKFKKTETDTINSISENVNKLKKEYKNLLGIGIIAPGPVDLQKGVILNPPDLKLFNNFNIVEAIKDATGIDNVCFEKDTNALALAEKIEGNRDNFLYLLADSGLGSAFIKDGLLFKGALGFGCEIGHISLDINGEACFCGNKGCAELYTANPRIAKMGNQTDYNTLCIIATKGDEKAVSALNYQGEMLGLTLVSFINLFEPESIVLGGDLTNGSFILIPKIKEIIEKQVLSRATRKINIFASTLKEDARAKACANLVIENYLAR